MTENPIKIGKQHPTLTRKQLANYSLKLGIFDHLFQGQTIAGAKIYTRSQARLYDIFFQKRALFGN